MYVQCIFQVVRIVFSVQFDSKTLGSENSADYSERKLTISDDRRFARLYIPP